MDLIQFFKKPYAWIIVAFIAGFAVNQVLTGMHLNPMQGRANFYDASFGGIPVDCTSFYGDTIHCANQAWLQNRWGGFGGGYGGYGGGTSGTAPTGGPGTQWQYNSGPERDPYPENGGGTIEGSDGEYLR